MHGRLPSSPIYKEFRFPKSKNEVMLVTFFDSHGIIHKAFVPPGQTVNKEYYVEVLPRVVQRIRPVRPQLQKRRSWFLLHGNARPHTAVSIRQVLGPQKIQI
jgi:hypothetical protein